MNLACLLIPPDMVGKVPLVSFIKTICPWRIASRTPLKTIIDQGIFLSMCPHEESNLDFNLRRIAPYPLGNGDGIFVFLGN